MKRVKLLLELLTVPTLIAVSLLFSLITDNNGVALNTAAVIDCFKSVAVLGGGYLFIRLLSDFYLYKGSK